MDIHVDQDGSHQPRVIVPCSPEGLWAEMAEPSLSGTENQGPLQGLEAAFTPRSASHSPLPWRTSAREPHVHPVSARHSQDDFMADLLPYVLRALLFPSDPAVVTVAPWNLLQASTPLMAFPLVLVFPCRDRRRGTRVQGQTV